MLAATNEHPDDVQAWLNLGQGYLRIAQWPLARRSFEHADRLSHGTSADALNGLGETIVYENNASAGGGSVAPYLNGRCSWTRTRRRRCFTRAFRC